MKNLLLIGLLMVSFSGIGQQMRVGVLRHYSVKRIVFAYNTGDYAIYGDSSYLGNIRKNDFVDLKFIDSAKISVRKGANSLGTYSKIFLIQQSRNTSLSLQSKVPTVRLRKYKDDFRITADKNLTIVNLVDIDNYLAGVVESEGGGKRALEYYKVQAVMSRTYATKYKNKHASEGFDLCDRVHCQAYHSMMRFTPKIDTAVKATTGITMVDGKHKHIDAYFHANCGGQTCLPEYVWNNSVPYLSTFKDTFCIYTRQAKWTKKISKTAWREFLVNDYGFPVNDPNFAKHLYSFTQDDRLAFYVSPVLGIPLRDIRRQFKLKSTYFNVRPSGSYVIISGRGYGHGVGMCQEGAMKMAKYGYNYQQISSYYFPGAYFHDTNNEYFFKQSVPDIKPEEELEY